VTNIHTTTLCEDKSSDYTAADYEDGPCDICLSQDDYDYLFADYDEEDILRTR